MLNIFKGWIGEKFCSLAIRLFLDKKIYKKINNIVIPTSNGTTQIDHLLVSRYGIFVIETKNYKGWIFGSESQRKWTQTLYGKKFSFQNPLHQNYRHTQCLSEYLRADTNLFHSIIFFVGESTFKTEMPPNVLDTGMTSYIKSFKNAILEDSDVDKITEILQTLKKDRSLNNRAHLNSLKERHASNDTCPKCGSPLTERVAKKGPNQGITFLGCSSFPKCRFMKKN